MRSKIRAFSRHRVALGGYNYFHTVRELAAYRCGTILGHRGCAGAFAHSESLDRTDHA